MAGNGSDGAFNQTSGTANLNLNQVYQFTTFNLSAGAILSTTNTSGSVMYILCTGDATIAGDVRLDGKINFGKNDSTFTLDGNNIPSPGVGVGGSGSGWGHNNISGNGSGGTGGVNTYSASAGAATYPYAIGAYGSGVNWTYPTGLPVYGNYGYGSAGGSGNGTGTYVAGNWFNTGAGGSSFGGNGSNASTATSGSIANKAGGGGGAGGKSGISGIRFIIKARNITFTGVINTSGTAGQAGGNGGASVTYMGGTGEVDFHYAGGGGGGGGGNAGNIEFHYSVSLTDSGTKTMSGGSAGASGSNGTGINYGSGSPQPVWHAYDSQYLHPAGTAGSAGSFSSTFTGFTNASNAYSSNNSYATVAAANGDISVSLSKDGGLNFHNVITNTYTGTEGTQTFGGSTSVWGTTWTGTDVGDSYFRVKIVCGGSTTYSQIYGGFGFSLGGSYTMTGIEVAIEAKWVTPTTSIDHIQVKVYYGTSLIPIVAGSQAFATNGRKNGEGAGAGTGVLTFYDGTNWKACDTGATVAA